MRTKTDTESEKEEAVNVVNSFQRSVSMIGRSWKVEEDYGGGDVDVNDFTPSPMVPNKRYSAYDLESKSQLFPRPIHDMPILQAPNFLPV